MWQRATKKMKIAALMLLTACLTSRLADAAPSAVLSDKTISGIWKSWMLTDYEPKEPSGKKVVKSIFDPIRTVRPDCADGSEANASGKCIKIFSLGEAEQEKIHLDYLNKRYQYITGDLEEAAKNDSSMSQRFQIALPLVSAEYQDVTTVESPPPPNTDSDIHKTRDRNSKHDVNSIAYTDIVRKGPEMNTIQPKSQHNLNNIDTTLVPMYKKMRLRNTRRKNRTKQRRKGTRRPNRVNG